MKKRNIFFDIYKVALVLLVIMIHFHPYFLDNGIFRLAVPAFFMMSGFFFYSEDEDNQLKKAKGLFKNSLIYMLIGLGIYIVNDFIMCLVDHGSLTTFFTGLFYKNFFNEFFIYNLPKTSGYHLWFLIALFVSSIFNYLIVRFNLKKIYYFLPVLIIIPIFFSGYLKEIEGTYVSTMYTRNAIFYAMPLISIGYLIKKHAKRNNIYDGILYLILFILFFYTQSIEKKYIFKHQCEIYVSSILASICMIRFLMSLPSINAKYYYLIIGKNASYYMYVFHMLVARLLVKYFNVTERSWKICFITFFITLAIAILIQQIQNIISLIKKKCYNRNREVVS